MTTVYAPTWEQTLLPLAYEAEHRDAAPVGEDTLTVLVPAGHLDTRSVQDWDAL